MTLNNNTLIIGIDEVARGCLAGPVFSSAIILKPDILNNWETIKRPRITDSKKLNPQQRQHAKDWIINHGCISWGIGSATVEEIDTYNIREATFIAMNRALSNCLSKLPDIYKSYYLDVIIDGNAFKTDTNNHIILNWKENISYHTQIKGDIYNPSIACASIVAKEIRDADLDDLVLKHPQDLECYNWKNNRGYGTRDHIQAILMNGITVWHRLSFLKKLLHSG